MDPLTDLLAKYVEAQPRATRGGIAPLRGYDFQSRVYLADFVSKLVSGEDLFDAYKEFTNAFEGLADYTRSDGNNLVCVQAKTRLDPATASQAAIEFCRIDEFLEHTASPLRSSVKYELVAQHAEYIPDWRSIKIPQEALARHPSFGDRWHHLILTQRLSAFRIEPDPWWRLISSIFSELRDPYAFARRSLERCLRFGYGPSEAAKLRDAIAEDFVISRSRSRDYIEAIPYNDALEKPDDSRQFIISATPTLDHLRRGYFMSRSARVNDVLETIDAIASQQAGQDSAAIDVLWIEGRSGCGKSVLLLQVMQYLRLTRDATILWYGNSVHKLPELLAQLTATDPRHPGPDFVFIDDIYDPQSRDDLSISRLIGRIIHTPNIRWPIIVTCGPTEFRQALERDCRAEGLRLRTFELSPLNPTETTELVQWFEHRSGETVSLGPAAKQQDALILSVLFELRHGDLRPFALRFSARLRAADLHEVLRIPLALNRLYIWTPASWLSSEQLNRLDTLNQGGDFSVVGPEMRSGYLRLTHPHLSDSIYRSIYEYLSPKSAALDIIAAFKRALDFDFATALRLLRTVAFAHSRLQIVDRSELAIGMDGLLTVCKKAIQSRSNEELAYFWCWWSRWAARDTTVSRLSEVHDPISRAVDALGTSHQMWPRLWADLWQCVPGHAELKRIALDWLRDHPGEAFWDVPWRALTDYENHGDSEIIGGHVDPELMQLGWNWVRNYTDHPGSSWVWEGLLRFHALLFRSVPRAAVLSLTEHWLDRNLAKRGWSFVWCSLLRASSSDPEFCDPASVMKRGWTWLADHSDNPGWSFVYQDLLRTIAENPNLTISSLLDAGRLD